MLGLASALARCSRLLLASLPGSPWPSPAGPDPHPRRRRQLHLPGSRGSSGRAAVRAPAPSERRPAACSSSSPSRCWFKKRFGRVCTSLCDSRRTLSLLLGPRNVLYLLSQDNSQYGGGLAHSGGQRLNILLAKRLHARALDTTGTWMRP